MQANSFENSPSVSINKIRIFDIQILNMQNSPKRFTITAALPYTNGPVHIGHLAGVYVPADIYSRFQRMQGNDVAFVCGSDEHGVPITIKAKKEGITPQQVVDKYHAIIKHSFQDFGITFDNYSRTTAKIHHDTASEFFKKLYEDGKFIEQTTEQFYDREANQFLADRFIVGTCPKCGFEESYGDQCESCGTSHNATDLINPKSSITGNTPSLKETKHWFLPLDQYEPWLKDWIVKGHKKDWKTNVYGQCKSWIDDGLRPRAVTRDLDWGFLYLLKMQMEKYCMFGLMLPLVIFLLRRNGQKKKEKIGSPIGKTKTPNYFIL